MKMNEKGMALICEFESCQKRDLLNYDFETLCSRVRSAVTATLDDNQFSALVSFAHNVGLDNFRRSSVLRSVNSREFDKVPADLALWVKARDKVRPRLIRRRAAEAALFLLSEGAASISMPNLATRDNEGKTSADFLPTSLCVMETGRGIEPMAGGAFHSDHIKLAAVLSAAGGLLSSFAHHLEEWLGQLASLTLEVAAVLVVILAAIWIIQEHRRQTAQKR